MGHIEDVVHATKCIVNKEGTEAAAATVAIMLKNYMGREPDPLQANFNVPFVMVVSDNETGCPLCQ